MNKEKIDNINFLNFLYNFFNERVITIISFSFYLSHRIKSTIENLLTTVNEERFFA